MPTLTRAGVSLSYRDEGKGPAVLLLHAFPLNSDCYWPQLESLSGKWRLIAPDHRGFGQSKVGQGPTEMRTMAEDALAILDACGVDRAVVAGVSMGGYAAMALLRVAPSRVRALVLVDTQARADDEEGRARREQTARAVEERGVEVLVESMLPKLVAPECKPEVRSRIKRQIEAASRQGAAAALRGMALRPDSREVLKEFKGPALVVAGEKDAIIPVDRAEELAGLLSGSRLVKLPGAGHLPQVEVAEAFNRELHAFLSTLNG